MIFTKNERKLHYMGAILEYKCPCCGGPLQFDTDVQKMKCPYCDNEFDAETLKENDDILKEEKPDMMDWSSQPGNEWMKGELDGQKVYLCPAAVRLSVTKQQALPNVHIAEVPLL